MRKKFLFIVEDFDVGGITTSLRNFVNILVEEGHKVSIVNFAGVSALPGDFNPKIELIELKGKAKFWNFNIQQLKKECFLKYFYLLPLAIFKKIMNAKGKWQKFIFSKTRFDGYDVAIAFRQSPFSYSFVSNKTDAKNKMGFWHGDPDYMPGIESWDFCLNYLDCIACVSMAVRDKMAQRYPDLKEKFGLVYNIFNEKEILEKSGSASIEKNSNVFNMVTVSRIDFEQKNIDYIPEVCKYLKDNNYRFKWTVVGSGMDYDRFETLIKNNEVEDCLFLAGNQANPYPYIKASDLFVLPAKCEAYGMVLTESLIVGTPCVSTEYSALKEVISDGINGIISENSVDGLCKCIEKILLDKNLYNNLKQNAVNYNYDYKIAYNQLLGLCN